MSAKRAEETIILEANDNDVLLGRGNAVNFRGGNVRFRQLAQTKALRYATCSNKLEKDRIAASILSEIKSLGGRFLRPISVRNDKGEHLSAWEPVDEEVAMTKAKQTLRDCAAAIRKETALRSSSTSPASYDSSTLFQSAISGSLTRGGGQVGAGGFASSSFLGHAASPTTAAMPDSSALAMSMQRSILEQLASRPAMDSLGSTAPTTSSTSSANAAAAAAAVRHFSDQPPYGLPSQLVLDNQQSRLLQAIRQQQQRADLESIADGGSSGRSSFYSYHPHHNPPSATTTTSTSNNAISDVHHTRETILIDQYRREQALAEAQQRILWSQLSEHARAQYEASFFPSLVAAMNQHHPLDVLTLRRIVESQCRQNLQGLDQLISSSGTGPAAASIRPDTFTRMVMLQDQFNQPLLGYRGTSTTATADAPAVASGDDNINNMMMKASSSSKSSNSSEEEEGSSSGAAGPMGKAATTRRDRSSSSNNSQPPIKKARARSSGSDTS